MLLRTFFSDCSFAIINQSTVFTVLFCEAPSGYAFNLSIINLKSLTKSKSLTSIKSEQARNLDQANIERTFNISVRGDKKKHPKLI
jgi:hypothetical protein